MMCQSGTFTFELCLFLKQWKVNWEVRWLCIINEMSMLRPNSRWVWFNFLNECCMNGGNLIYRHGRIKCCNTFHARAWIVRKCVLSQCLLLFSIVPCSSKIVWYIDVFWFKLWEHFISLVMVKFVMDKFEWKKCKTKLCTRANMHIT